MPRDTYLVRPTIEKAGRFAGLDMINAVYVEAESASNIPGVVERGADLVRAALRQIDWRLYEKSFGSEQVPIPQARQENRGSKLPYSNALTLTDAAHYASELLIGTIVNKAKSSADVSELIERAVGILRTTLRQEDWEIYQHYDKKAKAVTRKDGDAAIKLDASYKRFPVEYQLGVEGIRQSGEVVVYEGLPNRYDERYYHERTSNLTFILQYWRFYMEPLALGIEDAARLTELCCDPEQFGFDDGLTLCMFHPDYCLEWRHDEDVTRVLFCFSCSEVMILRGETEQVFPLQGRKQNSFKALLEWYPKHCPPK
ncbi:MAG: hypothetical protein ABI700_07875 [Chloroflexota bacterium]